MVLDVYEVFPTDFRVEIKILQSPKSDKIYSQ